MTSLNLLLKRNVFHTLILQCTHTSLYLACVQSVTFPLLPAATSFLPSTSVSRPIAPAASSGQYFKFSTTISFILFVSYHCQTQALNLNQKQSRIVKLKTQSGFCSFDQKQLIMEVSVLSGMVNALIRVFGLLKYIFDNSLKQFSLLFCQKVQKQFNCGGAPAGFFFWVDPGQPI